MKAKSKGRGRNLHAIAPIMRKGGAHQKSNGAQRALDRRELKQHLRKEQGCNKQGQIGRQYSADSDFFAA